MILIDLIYESRLLHWAGRHHWRWWHLIHKGIVHSWLHLGISHLTWHHIKMLGLLQLGINMGHNHILPIRLHGHHWRYKLIVLLINSWLFYRFIPWSIIIFLNLFKCFNIVIIESFRKFLIFNIVTWLEAIILDHTYNFIIYFKGLTSLFNQRWQSETFCGKLWVNLSLFQISFLK